VPGAPAARREICHRSRRNGVQRAVPAAVAAGHCHRARRDTLADTTLRQYLYDLNRRLDRIIVAIPTGEPGRKLRNRMLANRAHLFVFMTNRAVPYTNNVPERHLRPSVIFRKVTDGFRCEWGAETYAAFRSVASTANANGASVLETVRFVLAANLPEPRIAAVGCAITPADRQEAVVRPVLAISSSVQRPPFHGGAARSLTRCGFL
jgi:hypothetical protein